MIRPTLSDIPSRLLIQTGRKIATTQKNGAIAITAAIPSAWDQSINKSVSQEGLSNG